MNNESVTLSSSIDACLSVTFELPSTTKPEEEPFLNFDVNSDLSFDDESGIYCSLVALVKAEYMFDDVLQDRAAQFLKILEPFFDEQLAAQLVTDLVPSSVGSPSGFSESILTLLSSPHSTLVEATMIIRSLLYLATPYYVRNLSITSTLDKNNHRKMIFQKVLLPSSPLVTFLISNRQVLHGFLFRSIMWLLSTHLEICPYHRPTLEYVFASPISMTFSNCLSFFEDDGDLWNTLNNTNRSLQYWKEEDPEVVLSGKRIVQALFSEGFEDTLEQMMMYDKNGDYDNRVGYDCLEISQRLRSNVEVPEE
ncbi:hypothetical protein BLNAU_4972 [Blattamonas nauphoetae]|uniref:Uncharacterized protein n=1 Tax=Blattamonas nauphoetae TaxID=2049346 RepID=A0ABQ9Y8S8_9EUKA|nr:hypothetical protein BLNAU_4972 [Blattamonas nauphoetae]